MTIGEKIKKLRKENGMRQVDVAEQLGTKYQTVGKWERNDCEPNTFYLILLADLFKVSLDELCCRERNFLK